MVEKHSQSFFGQSCGLTLQSSSREEPFIFFKCIQKKPDGSWEKPSLGEGKTIKCSLDEIVMILQVLKRKLNSWSSYHSFNEVKTQISFQWENESDDKFWINIGKYSKMLSFAQVEIFRLLLEHLLKEKIEYATILRLPDTKVNVNQKRRLQSSRQKLEEGKTSVQEIVTHKNSEASQITGIIEGETEKALLINFQNGKELWVPKSTIHSNYDQSKNSSQTFIIDEWVLKKNKVETT